MKTDLELALEHMVNMYHAYAFRKPMDDYLSRDEFKALLKDTAKTFLDRTKPPKLSLEAYMEQLFVKADKNRTGRLKFTEFLTTMMLIAIDVHKRSHENPKESGPEHEHDHGH